MLLCMSHCYVALLLVLSTGGKTKGDDDEGGSLTPEDFNNAMTMDFSGEGDQDEDGSSDLFEGDIELSDADRDAMDRGIELREVVGSASRKWPKANGLVKVPYTMPSGLSAKRKADIAKVVNEFAKKTCIRLIPQKNERAYVHLNTNAGGCSSPLGMQGRKQTVNFGPRCSWGNLAHEFMHSLGFFHEHTRSDRDNYITISWDNIKKYEKQTKKPWKHNFLPCTSRGCKDLKVGYDYGSIMHYGPNLGSFRVITAKTKGAKFGQRGSLSSKDLIGINEHYGCGKPAGGCRDKGPANTCAKAAKGGRCKNASLRKYLKKNCAKTCHFC